MSCLAVMQGNSTRHIGLRATQRIVGTLAGLGITWVIAFGNPSAFGQRCAAPMYGICIFVFFSYLFFPMRPWSCLREWESSK